MIDEPLTVIFSRNGWVRSRQGWEVDPAGLSFKEGDGLLSLIKCRTVDPVIFLDSLGRAYTVSAGDLPPGRGDGVPASSLVELQSGGRIMYVVAGKPDTAVLVASTGGYGFLSKIADMVSNRKAGREFMTLDEGETPVAPVVYEPAGAKSVATVSEQGRLLVFGIDEMRTLARGRGVILMGLEKGEKLVAGAILTGRSVRVRGQGRGGKDKDIDISGEKLEHYRGHRARMGRVLPDKIKPTGLGG